jgi:PAS domain S-box-containing protein
MNLSDRWSQFFELSHDLLCIVDFEGRVVEFSRSWEALTGFSRHDLGTISFSEFLHPDDRSKAASEMALLQREPSTARLVGRFRSGNGSYKWLQWTLSSDIESRRICGIASAMSDLNTVEAEDLRRTNQILHSIVTACPHAIIAVDAERKVRIWNPAAERMFGWTESEVVGGRVPFVTDASRRDSDEFNKRALMGESFTNFEVQRTRRDGSAVDLLVSAAPTYDEKNKIDGFLTVATDVTEQKSLEKQLLRTQRLESVGTLVSGIAHDLNNVLAPIRMALDLFRERMPDPATQRTLDALDGCVGRGADLIRHVLTFAKGVQGERAPVQLRHLIRETEEVVSQTMPKTVVTQAQVPRDLWSVEADATQLHQVLMNLCVNARDAMPDGGTLRITARNVMVDSTGIPQNPEAAPGPYVLIDVADTGSGIPPEIQRKVFEPFFTTKEVGKGTGLGLSTVAGIVRSHEGFINLYSEVGRGTSFKVYLPAIEDPADVVRPAPAPAIPVGNGELIMLVDDEAAVRDIARLTLETHGYKVVEARDGAEGVAVYAMNRSDIRLVICDMDMPVMNGASMVRSLERIDPAVRVISASGLVVDRPETLELPRSGAVRVQLRKPYTALELLRTVHEVLTAD